MNTTLKALSLTNGRLLPLLALPLLALASAVQAADTASTAAAQPAKKILFFTKSVSFEHDPIKTGDNPRFGVAFRVFTELGAKHNFEFTYSKDGSLFSDEYLAKFDALMFYSQDGSGALTTPGLDKAPPMTAAGKEALLKAVAGGKGFVGIHSASDTFHSVLPDGTRGQAGYRVANGTYGDAADPYIKMLGGEFIGHGQQQKSRMIVADPKFPGISALPADYGPNEEWYSLKNFPADLHVILVQDTTGMTGNDYARPPYPATWARMQGKGRVFYTNMGHRDDVWQSAEFQSILLGGLNWATGRVDADVTPNLDKVTPKANELPAAPVRGARGGPGAPGAGRGGPGRGPGGAPAAVPGVAPAASADPAAPAPVVTGARNDPPNAPRERGAAAP